MDPEGSLPRPQEPPLVPILSQMNPVHTLPPYFMGAELSQMFTIASSLDMNQMFL
jgi:hypothetical protein